MRLGCGWRWRPVSSLPVLSSSVLRAPLHPLLRSTTVTLAAAAAAAVRCALLCGSAAPAATACCCVPRCVSTARTIGHAGVSPPTCQHLPARRTQRPVAALSLPCTSRTPQPQPSLSRLNKHAEAEATETEAEEPTRPTELEITSGCVRSWPQVASALLFHCMPRQPRSRVLQRGATADLHD